ncbi:MAG: hypothetical protein O3B13_18130 [Planctomycetota bacterium]|nr:hypothetical protein [Planctomycetota bacterium]
MRRTIVAFVACACAFGMFRPASAQDALPTVTVMLSGTGELEADLEAIMKMGGEDAEAQWPVIQAILPAFNAGIDPTRPIRVDIIFGKVRDYRISIPYDQQKDILDNIAGFVGAKPRRIGSGLYSLTSPAFNGFLRDLAKLKYVIIAADRNNIPANFNPLPDLQPLLAAGYDLAASVKNTAGGVADRRAAIDDLRKELLAGLKKATDESDQEFEIRRVGLVHQLVELERLFTDSESLVLGWTTDASKKEGRLNLELTALPDSDLQKSINELGAEPSLFSASSKSEESIFFGRVNHALDEMRQTHLKEMLELLAAKAASSIGASESVAAEHKSAANDAATAFFEMLQTGTKMGVFDGFVNVEQGKEGRTITGAIRAADGKKIDAVLASLKAAGWDIELSDAAADKADGGAAEKPAAKPGESSTADPAEASKAESAVTEPKPAAAAEDEEAKKPADEKVAADAPAKTGEQVSPETAKLAVHKVKVPQLDQADFQNLFGKDVTLLVTGTANAVYYSAGPAAEEHLRKAVAESGEDPAKNDGTIVETFTRLGSWLEYLKDRRARREAGKDLSALSKEEKIAREERAKIRDMAIGAFSKGKDTIHMQMMSDQKKVTGLTTISEGILRFVGMMIADVAETKLQ